MGNPGLVPNEAVRAAYPSPSTLRPWAASHHCLSSLATKQSRGTAGLGPLLQLVFNQGSCGRAAGLPGAGRSSPRGWRPRVSA